MTRDQSCLSRDANNCNTFEGIVNVIFDVDFDVHLPNGSRIGETENGIERNNFGIYYENGTI